MRRDAWVARPGTRSRKVSAPALAVTRSRPVGSGTTQASARPAAAQRREGAEPAVLLAGHAGEQQVAAQRDAGPAYGRDRGERRDQAGLHVARAAAVQLAVDDPPGERVRASTTPRGRRSARRRRAPLSISVAPSPRAGQPADQPPRLVALDLDAGEVGRGEQLVERQPPVVDLEPGRGEVGGEQRLDLVLGVGAAHAGDARPARRSRASVAVGAGVDLVEHAGRPVGHGASLGAA